VNARRFVVPFALAVAIGGCGGEAPAPTASVTATPPPPPAAAVPPAEPQRAMPAIEHAPIEAHVADASEACRGKSADANAKPALAIHRWVDAQGVTHYSDQAPTTSVSAHRVLEAPPPAPIEVTAKGYDAALPSDLQQRAIVDALAVQRVFRDALGIADPASARINIVFVREASAYSRLVGAGALAASAGAYVPPQRTIYVRMQADAETSFEVLRHEITHALIHELVGNLPIPLNEGLAEYFRRYRAAGMGGQIDLSSDRAALVAAAPAGEGSDALVELLAHAGTDFYAADRERRYAEAYALIAVLMQSPAGTAALHETLARQRAAPCAPIAAETILDQRYPGGLAALAADWAGFLRDPPAVVRAY